jgi:NCS1 family nucleobase:cation symporter-1
MMPWKLMATFGSYIFGWLVGYSGLLGPIAGVMITDYFLLRKTRLELDDLYIRGGRYEFMRGKNPRAILALFAGIIVALIGLIIPALHWLYDYAWFVGFAVASMIYFVTMRREVVEEMPAVVTPVSPQ